MSWSRRFFERIQILQQQQIRNELFRESIRNFTNKIIFIWKALIFFLRVLKTLPTKLYICLLRDRLTPMSFKGIKRLCRQKCKWNNASKNKI